MPLAGEVVRKSYLCPHAARGYRVKLQRQGYTARRTTEKSQLNRLVGGSLTLAPISNDYTCMLGIQLPLNRYFKVLRCEVSNIFYQ